MKKFDLIVICIVAIIALVSLIAAGALRLPGGAERGTDGSGGETANPVVSLQAEIHKDGKLYQTLPLSMDTELTVKADSGYNHIVVADGAVRVDEADCSGQECVHIGAKNHDGDIIACLPHRVLIKIRAAEGAESPEVGETDQQIYSADFFSMDTVMSISAYGNGAEQAVKAAQALVEDIDKKTDVHLSDSAIHRVNEAGDIKNSDPLVIDLLSRGYELSELCDGAFDMTIRPVITLWNIGKDDARIPSDSELNATLAKVDYRNVKITGKNIKLQGSAQIDLGGIAKGYAADKAAGLFREGGIDNALIALSGNIYALGKNEEGDDWQIGVQDPDHETDYIAVIFAQDESVVTSGEYERYSVLDGKKYGHIFDPKTGCPPENDLKSVTIVSKDSTLADAYSTALFVMGKEKALAFQKKYADSFDAVLVTADNEIVYTPGIKDRIFIAREDGKYSLIEG